VQGNGFHRTGFNANLAVRALCEITFNPRFVESKCKNRTNGHTARTVKTFTLIDINAQKQTPLEK